MKQTKTTEFFDLTLLNHWMFKHVMANPDNLDIVKEITERCIKRKIKYIKNIIPEASQDPFFYSPVVRFDVMFEGDDFYCVIELQNYEDNLPIRSKYYHDVLDLLDYDPGDKYDHSKDTYVLFFLNKDYLKGNLAKYTVKSKILENSELKYDDKRTTIFINPGALC